MFVCLLLLGKLSTSYRLAVDKPVAESLIPNVVEWWLLTETGRAMLAQLIKRASDEYFLLMQQLSQPNSLWCPRRCSPTIGDAI